MRKLLCFFLLLPFLSIGQVPTKCLEIEKILVDACVPGGGCTSSTSPNCSCEGKNEMVLFQVGPNDINIADLYIDWPNNTYRGIQTPDATTAGLTATLNSTILSCGWLVEPVGGILPAGKRVLLITSTDMCTTANSFEGLSDTLILIFQVAGNYQGHFANYNSTPGIRKLIMGDNISGCKDTVEYDRSLLVNINGTYGGTTSQKDGAGVAYDWPGNPTYYNDGCTAPMPPPVVDTIKTGSYTGAADDTLICPGSTITVTGVVENAIKQYWESEYGIFGDTSATTTTYTDTSMTSHYIYLKALSPCKDTLTDSLFITYHPNVSVTLNVSSNITICDGNNTVLSATGADNYFWSTGETTPSITITTAGQYMVTGTNVCYSDTDTVSVAVLPIVTLTSSTIPSSTICDGNQAIISVTSNASSYIWSTAETTPIITVTAAGTYSVSASNACNTITQSFNISVISAVNVSISSPSNALCAGSSMILSASSGYTYLWSTGESTQNITITSPGTFQVTASNSCFSSVASTTITPITNITATLSVSPSANLCEGQQGVLSVIDNGVSPSYLWSSGETTSSITVTNSGIYTVSVSDVCGFVTLSESVSVTPQITLTVNASSNLLCPNDIITITASGAGNYLWNSGNTTSAITVSSAGVYSVTASNNCFSETQSISITQGTVAIASISAADSILCHSTDEIVLKTTSNYQHVWSTGATTDSIIVNKEGEYYVIASASCNSDTAFYRITDGSVQAEIIANPMDGEVPLEITFYGSSTNANQYSWWQGETEIASVDSFSYTLNEPGAYIFTLIAQNTYGCSDTVQITINGEAKSTVFIPNVFSPNDDNINDVFKVVFGNPDAVEDIQVQIFNRWGGEIFGYSSIVGYWDGRNYAGQLVPDGTYLYIIRYKIKDKEPVELRGTIEKTGTKF